MRPNAEPRSTSCRSAVLVVVLLGLLYWQTGDSGRNAALAGLRQRSLDKGVSAAAAASGTRSQPSTPAKEPSFNVIVTTAGRDTLSRMLESIAPQLTNVDHLTVISDKGHEEVAAAVAKVKCACTVRHIPNPEPLGFWGHGSRSRWQNELPGDYHMNADDDDVYDPNAMATVRRVVDGRLDPPTLYIFHMIRRWDGVVELIPPRGQQTVAIKKIGTPCGVYRKIPDLPPWHGSYGGDGGFYVALSQRVKEVKFVPEVIYQVRQDEDLLSIKDSVP
jgi:hypothetical protein